MCSRAVRISILILNLSFIATASIATASESVKTKTIKEKNYFPKMQGCFLLYNLKTDKFEKVIGDERCKERFVACSTFKVPLAVMAFDSNTLKDENETYKWDGVQRDIPAWNQDTNAKSWMANSVVWFSQKLTPKLGTIKVTEYLKKFKYGNEDIGSGLTDAWLKPVTNKKALKISAYEQVDFMKALWRSQLPVSQRAMDLTKEITYLETSTNGFKMNGKTGSNFVAKEKGIRFGWFISHIEKGQQEYIAVTNFSDDTKSDSQQFGGAQAKEITKTILKDQGLW
jgi:Beta-lactamase class D